jgi:tetratricopeptide (TPR) repeat protein
LETIVLKAIAKEPASRYRTCEAMAEDLRRYLSDRPILARRSTMLEQLVRWRRRNPVVAALAGALALLLVSSVVVLAVSNARIRSESAAKDLARKDAEDARRDERSARKQAEARAEEILQGHERLKAAVAMVDQARIHRGLQHWDTAVDAYSDAIQSYPQFAQAWEERGDTYLRLGLVDLAAHDINSSVELQPPQIGWQWFRHALLRAYENDWSGHRHACAQMHQAYKALHSAPSPQSAIEVVRAYVLVPNPDANLEDLIQFAESAIARGSRYQWMLHVLGTAHYRAGHFEDAIRICTESLDSDPDWVSRSTNFPILAMAHHKLGHVAESQDALRQAMVAYERWTEQMLNSEGPWVVNQGASEKLPIDPLDWLAFLIHVREARACLGMGALDETRLMLRSARALAALRRASEAHAEFSRVAQLAPNDPLIQLESRRYLAYYHATSERYEAGANGFAEAVQLAPEDAELWRFLAAANLAAGRDVAYRETCRDMVQRFANSTDPAVASSVTEVCVCCATTLDDWNQLLPIARIGAQYIHDSPRFLAAAQFRAGEYSDALATFGGVERLNSLRAFDLFFLAMTHDRLGQRNDALRRLDQAYAWIEEADVSATMTDAKVLARADWGAWTERPLTLALQKEAEAMIAARNLAPSSE